MSTQKESQVEYFIILDDKDRKKPLEAYRAET